MAKMNDVLQKIKKTMKKIGDSGCMRGWERKHFTSRHAEAAEKVCSSKQPSRERNRLRKPRPPEDVSCSPKIKGTYCSDSRPKSPAEDEPHLSRDDGAGNTMAAVFPNAAVSKQLQQAVLQNRAMRKEEQRTDTRLDELDQESAKLGRQIRRLAKEIDKISQECTEDDGKQLPELRQKLSVAQQKQAGIDEQRQAAEQALQSGWREQRLDVHLLFAAFDEIFVASNVLEPESDEDDTLSQSSANECARPDGEHESYPEANTAGADIADVQNAVLDAPDDESKAKALIEHYLSMGMKLRAMENYLERRDEYLAIGVEERERKIGEGEEVQSQEAFDHYQLELIRSWTRDIAEAEAEVEQAKEAVIAAGLQIPGSQVTSGFVDDVNDGYRLSEDEAMRRATNPVRVQKWVDGLPDPEPPSPADRFPLPEEGICDGSGSLAEGVEVDDWDAHSVDICDSWSLVADGAEKRRIDKWRRICGLD
ncbi:hypothetical protein LTR37_011906 [Vermiconidia calcicola]|uniref:Uncharacterized protein n=1 Tax=Vermiconidia calcicola TaxID=1690605 RepID=A0ACC3N0P0_9PEZI|nr:hypothetical protein LTR37_011906 [Vermiconidia calcicola]